MRTYATWNPSDKSAGVTLSGGNLTAAVSITPGAVRSTIGKSSGKWYWEMTVGSVDGAGNPLLSGIGLSTADINSSNPYPGSDANGYGYYGANGQKYNNGSGAAYGATYTTNDVIGFALDMGAGTITFYKNGVSQGTAFTSLSGTFFALVGGTYGASVSGTYNFGATTFAQSVPSGFNPGLYDDTNSNFLMFM